MEPLLLKKIDAVSNSGSILTDAYTDQSINGPLTEKHGLEAI